MVFLLQSIIILAKNHDITSLDKLTTSLYPTAENHKFMFHVRVQKS